MDCASDSQCCSALISPACIESLETDQCAPRPLRSLATRLGFVAPRHRAWRAYLPRQSRCNPQLLAAAADTVPALAEDDAEDVACVRRTVRTHTSSTCSTSLGDMHVEDSEESCDEDSSIVGRVWKLSQDPLGSRLVQAALERADSEEQRCLLAHELCGHVHEIMRCPHGNHVVQKIINTMQRPESLQFIIDALTHQDNSIVQAAKHRYATRIIEHLLRVCPPAQVSEIVENLLKVVGTLACHSVGHYILRHLLECGTKDQQYQLVRSIEQNACRIGRSTFGGIVLETMLTHTAVEDKAWVARAFAQDPAVMLCLAKTKRGHASVLLLLDTLQGYGDHRALSNMAQHMDALKASRFGRIVAQRLETACEQSCL
mmetsp:Transcript_139212/g.352935  ORF Transcript_139212/g.352935 Transcript_139212/m.352935 type:complete len:373 (-) Transcript_139212:118-1236(-)